jgi:hypothetical protein
MTNNIYRVINEPDLNEILLDNSHRLVCFVFLTKNADPQLNIKKCFIQMAYENPNNFFIYIDLNSFTFTEKRFTFDRLPTTFYYLDNEEIANVQGNNVDKIYDTFNQLIKLINQKISENKTTVNINTNFFNNQPSNNQPLANQPANQSVNQSSDQPSQNQLSNQSSNQPSNQPSQNQLSNQSSNQPSNQPSQNQPSNNQENDNNIENEQINNQILAFQKLREMQQILTIQQLEKLKKIKELEEKHKM